MGEEPIRSPALHVTFLQYESCTALALLTVSDMGPGLIRICQVIKSQQLHHTASTEDALCRQCFFVLFANANNVSTDLLVIC